MQLQLILQQLYSRYYYENTTVSQEFAKKIRFIFQDTTEITDTVTSALDNHSQTCSPLVVDPQTPSTSKSEPKNGRQSKRTAHGSTKITGDAEEDACTQEENVEGVKKELFVIGKSDAKSNATKAKKKLELPTEGRPKRSVAQFKKMGQLSPKKKTMTSTVASNNVSFAKKGPLSPKKSHIDVEKTKEEFEKVTEKLRYVL